MAGAIYGLDEVPRVAVDEVLKWDRANIVESSLKLVRGQSKNNL